MEDHNDTSKAPDSKALPPRLEELKKRREAQAQALQRAVQRPPRGGRATRQVRHQGR